MIEFRARVRSVTCLSAESSLECEWQKGTHHSARVLAAMRFNATRPHSAHAKIRSVLVVSVLSAMREGEGLLLLSLSLNRKSREGLGVVGVVDLVNRCGGAVVRSRCAKAFRQM